MPYSNIKSDKSERVLYDKADYPAYIKKGVLSSYPNYTAQSHWHDDLEFIYIISGHMLYNINGEIILMKEKEGVFVNARQLHFGYSEDRSECIFICVLLHPILLCLSKNIEQKYVVPLISNNEIMFYHLKGNCEWEKVVLSSIQKMYDYKNDKISELKIQREFFNIWIELCENIISIKKENNSNNHHLSILKTMISYIDQNYRWKISLEDIAFSGSVGKTNCCMLFKKYVNKTPNEYLTELRLRKSIELLQKTDMTVLEICYEVGFSGASYFTEVFHKYFDCTPSMYRQYNLQQKGL